MADKRAIRQNLHYVERIKTWQLVIVFILLLFVSATFVRLNSIGMDQRRKAVISADQAGDDNIVQNRLYDLQAYTSKHMITSTGDVYLTEKYNRDVAEAVARAERSNSANKNIFRESDAVCKQRFSGYSQGYVQCVYAELAKYPEGDSPIDQVKLPSPYLYKHSFVSPAWSPDFAGWSILLTLVVGALIVIRILTVVVLKMLLRRDYKSI